MAKTSKGTAFDESAYLEAMSQGHSFTPGADKPPQAPPSEPEESQESRQSPPEPVQRPPMRRTTTPSQYEVLFLTSNEPVRQRTFVGVRPEFYSKLVKITKRLGQGVSLQGLVDNILRHHFETYADEINRLNREANKKDIM